MISFTTVAAALISKLGLAGIAVGVFLNGLSVPGLSEVLLPLSGVAVRQGKLNFVALFVVAMVAQLVGVSVAYAIARYGGVALVERYGKYVLISHSELEHAQGLFERRGTPMVIVGGCVPGVQGLVGYVAGLAQMNYLRFIVSVSVGKVIWVGGLIYLGTVMGDHLDLIDKVIKQVGVVILAGFILSVGYYLWRHRSADNDQSAATETGEK